MAKKPPKFSTPAPPTKNTALGKTIIGTSKQVASQQRAVDQASRGRSMGAQTGDLVARRPAAPPAGMRKEVPPLGTTSGLAAGLQKAKMRSLKGNAKAPIQRRGQTSTG